MSTIEFGDLITSFATANLFFLNKSAYYNIQLEEKLKKK